MLPDHTIPRDLIEEAEKNVKKKLDKANAILSMNLRFEGVKFFSRSKMAGYVIPSQDNIVYLNLDLFKANFPQFVKDTIPHEVAHLFAYSLVGRREGHHGPTWKNVMRNVFRAEPNRTHSFDLSVVDLP
jgi:SprT protein